MAFMEDVFPDIEYTSQGGPRFSNEVVETEDGSEQRNQLWTYDLREYDVLLMNVSAQHDTFINFFNAAQGSLNPFRFKDEFDYVTGSLFTPPVFSDEFIGTGDASTTVFQITKTYTAGSATHTRPLKKIISSTTAVGINGTERPEVTDWSVDINTGQITFTSAPAAGASITCGCEYHIAVRFDSDVANISYDYFDITGGNFKLREVRL